MDKEQIYNEFALLPKDDGTFQRYKQIFLKHPQSNRDKLIRACKEFTEYVNFCMETYIGFRSKLDGRYKQFPKEELNMNDFIIKLYETKQAVKLDTDLSTINYPNIAGLLKMVALGEDYEVVFNRLLDGKTFLK
ncbi:hypothetical protein AAGG74_14985 [Bacillus mexicanus]|uniref:hypothetical protein n=1 Tax=Bacillus mexicanus TaxID=2834415 RepID=UPI003D20E6BF